MKIKPGVALSVLAIVAALLLGMLAVMIHDHNLGATLRAPAGDPGRHP
jgi:hypothetical protein